MRPERFELPTPWFEAKYSIQLSYGRILKDGGQIKLRPNQKASQIAALSPEMLGGAFFKEQAIRQFVLIAG